MGRAGATKQVGYLWEHPLLNCALALAAGSAQAASPTCVNLHLCNLIPRPGRATPTGSQPHLDQPVGEGAAERGMGGHHHQPSQHCCLRAKTEGAF